MPFYLTPKTLTKQAKTLVKQWSHGEIKLTQAREILCKLYGYKSNHHYKQLEKARGTNLQTINQNTLFINYKRWIQRLAQLGAINEIEAKKILHCIWNNYLGDETQIPHYLYSALFTFYGELQDFVAESKVTYPFNDRPSVKDAIEALGIPHVEVGAMIVNGKNVSFEYLLDENAQVEVYPHNLVTSTMKSLPFKPKKLTFLLDVHLGALARYLRMAGFDTIYESHDYGDAFLAELASIDSLVLLSRDIGLLKRAKVKYGRWVRNTDPQEQFYEILKTYQLQNSLKPFSRCLKCNGSIEAVPKTEVKGQVSEKVYDWCDAFEKCQNCGQVYWRGSHYEKMQKMLLSYQKRVEKGTL